jgi:hypothetical protein
MRLSFLMDKMGAAKYNFNDQQAIQYEEMQ